MLEFTSEKFYFTAIIRERTVKSMRDLSREHLPLLENLNQSIKREVSNLLQISPYRIQMFIHYLPSFYHLHVHVVSHGLNIGNFVGKAHNLEDIIDNIKLDSEYY